ncbi:alpha/beta hydrolase [Streptomyces sp. ST2-7A]|uniref:alpha/beta hydrolase n=1 Tax=Streptomyces sp. ST2-7A TaxID=2907214 RepID=UPI001F48E56F|nr:alpha/beta fold hydrolase [Streptomyces sp. ST2-7A]MCE7079875.1 alpha/beta fold hydrolase [Streptomyces sp. ST2-7A]
MAAGRWVSVTWKVLAVVMVLWLLVVLAAWLLQRQLIYLPDRSAPAPPAGVEEVSYTAADGTELTAWFLPADSSSRPPHTTVVVANGNGGNRAGRVPLAEGLTGRGHAVLLTDYRGYGGNPGDPREEVLAEDFLAAVARLADRPDVDPERIVYLGESLGSAVVSEAAAERPPPALVLRSPFTELADVGRHHYPFLPVRTLLRERFPTAEHLSAYEGPVLVVAGDSDRIVPDRFSRRVVEEHTAGPISLHLIEGADHNDRAVLSGDEFLDTVDAFLPDALPQPSGND